LSIALLLAALLFLGCASARPVTSAAPMPPPREGEPDLGAMVELVGRFGLAHACPLGPTTLYTAGHVVDERPFEADVPLVSLRMSDSAGREDVALPEGVDRASDVALLRPANGPLSRWFVRATAAPAIGDRLWTLGYQRSSRTSLYWPRVVSATVVRVIAGHLVLSHGARPGSSGSCWINQRGEAVAVGIWDLFLDGGVEPAGMAAGIWPPWAFKGEGQ
jgi:S1-C subfamily serine protease